ncbi:MAG: hypothetical protein L0Y58_17290 [Verrucomicrobia subdivision 3 bacterium]|nr:hypothetical protein [Limisphaerales bacterium]
MRAAKIASVVVALHVIVLSLFFFKSRVNYFVVTCLSTAIVWSMVFSFSKRKKWVGIVSGSLVQLAIQQVAYHALLSVQAGAWWPLAQFLALQYLVALRLGSSSEEA